MKINKESMSNNHSLTSADDTKADSDNDFQITRSTLTEQIVNRLRDMIIQNQLVPGEYIRERVICSQLNVSRTPLREALHILATEGLIELIPNRGAMISLPNAEEVEDMLQVLGVLEGFAGEKACRRAKPEEIAEIKALHYEMLAAKSRGDRLEYFKLNQRIHLAIVETARSQTLKDHRNLLNARLYRIRYQSNLHNNAWQTAVEEHNEIMGALENRDAQKTAMLLKNHLSSTWKNISQNVFKK
jgi:DNA-binding GntR family transcriptional regulator